MIQGFILVRLEFYSPSKLRTDYSASIVCQHQIKRQKLQTEVSRRT